jgi:hypothetical protein
MITKTLIPLTHSDLVRAAVKWLSGSRRCGIVFAELSAACRHPIIPDAIGWSGEWSILVECKVSRSDFLADRSKAIHALPDSYPGQERWYLAPAGLLTLADMPDGWHLAEVRGNRVHAVSEMWGNKPVLPDSFHMYRAGRSMAEVPLLLSALRRYSLGVPFDSRTGRFRTIAEEKVEQRASE